MKKAAKLFILTAAALLMCFCLAFSACAEKTGGEPEPDKTEESGGSGGEERQDFGDVLIVYFSATNNTEKIAGYIADITGGTTFELVPQTPYTADDLKYYDSDSRVYKEYTDASLRDVPLVNATPENWEKYDAVFVGYPIWWGGASWVLNGFITANDFTGKTVIPFCTSAGSGIGSSDTQLKEMAGTGDWKAGRRFSPSDSKSAVQSWINGLQLARS